MIVKIKKYIEEVGGETVDHYYPNAKEVLDEENEYAIIYGDDSAAYYDKNSVKKLIIYDQN